MTLPRTAWLRLNRLRTSGVTSSEILGGQKIWVGKMFDFRRITLFCLEKRFSKHKMTVFSKNLVGGHGSFGPPGYAYASHWCRTFPLLFVQVGCGFLCGLWVWRRRPDCWPSCLSLSNPSTSSWTARPDGSERWDNRIAAQHLPRDLVRSSSWFGELAQKILLNYSTVSSNKFEYINL